MKTMASSVMVALIATAASSAAWALTPKDVYKKAGPAVVLILGSDDGKTGSGGTGSIITPEGKVITNAHVVLNERGAPFKILYVFLKPATVTGDNAKDLANRYKARVLNYSIPDELDLAVLQIENAPSTLPTVAFGNPGEVEVGDEGIAIGCPEQGGPWTLTTGAISTVIANFNHVKGKDVFQTEASVNRGNSGGPLLNDQGTIIGINTMIARQGADGIAITGVNFALKSSVAVKWLAGQGMGLAYAAHGVQPQVVVAAAEPPPARPAPAVEPSRGSGRVVAADLPVATAKPAADGDAPGATVAAAPPVAVQPAAPQPRSTIVVAEAPPKKDEIAKLKAEGKDLGKAKGGEKVVSGKPLDPKTAKPPKFVTEKHPYNLDDLRRAQMKELEDMMDEMRGKTEGERGSGGDMGLW
jgi:serine protease Do